MQRNKRKIAFIVREFPIISETFIISQVTDLIDREIDIKVFSFEKGDKENVSRKFDEYNLLERVHYLNTPGNYVKRFLFAIPKIVHIFFTRPVLLFKMFNLNKKYGRNALSLQLLYWIEPFINKKFDLIHCHFGNAANDFLIIKEILGLRQKIVTTFYGFDVSLFFKQKPANYYDKLKEVSSLFLVMSRNMKERLVEKGFNQNKIRILPVSIDVESYPYNKRIFHDGELFKIVSVGRFVEKKGFDDLLRAIAIVKEKSKRLFRCYIIGNGTLKDELFNMTERLNLNDVVEFKGYMKVEDIINYFLNVHLFVQPSKTARNGDME